MAKTKKETVKIDLDSLVEQNKNIDRNEIEKTIAKAKEGKAKENQKVQIAQTVEEIVETTEKEELPIEKLNDEEGSAEQELIEEVEENIDDVIAECTGEVGKVEEEVHDEVKKEAEPWYVARAKRVADYYNW